MAGNIKGITIEFRGDTTNLDRALRQINNETKSLDKQLRQVDRALKFNPGSVELWRQKQDLLNKKLKEAKDKVTLLKDTLKKVESGEIDMAAEDVDQLKRELIEAESKAKHFEAELRKIGNVNLKALGEKLKSVGDKMTKVGKDLTSKVTVPLAALGTVAAKKFADVDKTMQLTNATMGNTTEEAELLNKAMKTAAANSTYGMKDAADATLNFARAGLSAEQAADALAPAMALAAGEGGELDTVSAGLVATINGFHGSFDQAAEYADVFANACNNSALDIDSLSNAMSVAAPVFSAAGYNVKDAALYMGVMANNGIEASKAANSLKTGMARLVDPSKEGAEWMDKLGFSITNADGTMKDSVQIQKELHDAFAGLSESEQIAAASAIFGKNQMAPWLSLINTAPGDVDSLSEALDKEGTAMEMQSAMMSGFAGSIEQLKSGVDVLATSFGEALAPTIQKVAGVIQKAVNWFNSLSKKQQALIAKVALLAAALGPVLVILGTLISSIGSIISFAGMLLPAIGGVVAAFGPLILVIGAVIAVGVLLYKNWDKIKAKAVEMWNKLKTTFNSIKTMIVNTWNTVKKKISETVDTIKKKITDTWTTIKEKTKNAWEAVKDKIVKPFTTAKEKIDGVVTAIKKMFPIDLGNLFKNIKTPHFKLEWAEATVFGKTIKYPKGFTNLGWYKEGGVFNSPTVAGIGEAGPEAVVPLDKFWEKMDAIAEGSGKTYNFYITGDDPKAIAQEVKRILIADTKRERMAWQ